jgi:hypothetical protein
MTETEEALFLSSTPARVGPHRGAGGVRAEDYGHGAWIQGRCRLFISSIGAITGSGTGCGRGTAKRCDLRFISFVRMSEST